MKLCCCTVLLFLIEYSTVCGAKNVLFFVPALADSVVMQAGRLADLLVEDGHNVTFLIPEVVSTIKKDGSKYANVVRMEGFSDTFILGMKQYTNMLDPASASIKKRFTMGGYFITFCKELIERRHELDFLKRYKFDAYVSNDQNMCDLWLPQYLGIDTTVMTVTGPMFESTAYNLGIPQPTSYVPVLEDATAGSTMSLFKRIENQWNWLIATLLHKYITYNVNYYIRKLVYPNFPGIDALAADAAVVFVNNDEFLDFARPVLHKTIYIGGAGLPAPKPLNDKFENIMQKGRDGLVLVSFGSHCNTLAFPLEQKKEMIQAFSNFSNYHFLIKVTPGDNHTIKFGSRFKNVEFTHWTPQTDILGHPSLKAFITHGGINSVIEAATRGVPLITVPLFFDQFRNAKMVEQRGFGVILTKSEFGEEGFTNALTKVLEYPQYSLAARRISSLIKAKPHQPTESFLKWMNFVLEKGSLPELTPTGAKMHLISYFNVDILIISIATSIPFVTFVRYMYKVGLLFSQKLKNE
uniref:UDP-glucuronosyltransferase n=1 Tax=Panagrellus redivivus TaxID=6233 RepID=A0A7E4W5E2_PANRE